MLHFLRKSGKMVWDEWKTFAILPHLALSLSLSDPHAQQAASFLVLITVWRQSAVALGPGSPEGCLIRTAAWADLPFEGSQGLLLAACWSSRRLESRSWGFTALGDIFSTAACFCLWVNLVHSLLKCHLTFSLFFFPFLWGHLLLWSVRRWLQVCSGGVCVCVCVFGVVRYIMSVSRCGSRQETGGYSVVDLFASCVPVSGWRQLLRMTGRAWASVLKTQSSIDSRSSSENNRYRYLPETGKDRKVTPQASNGFPLQISLHVTPSWKGSNVVEYIISVQE